MAQLLAAVQFTLHLGSAELNMICRALRGQIHEEDRIEATTLAGMLARQRVSQTKNIIEGVDKLNRNLEQAEQEKG